MRKGYLALLPAVLALAGCSRPSPEPITGRWHAAVINQAGEEVPFVLDIAERGGALEGAIVNGDERIASTSGSFAGKTLKLGFNYWDGELTATLEGRVLKGAFVRTYKKTTRRRELVASREPRIPPGNPPPGMDIAGEWILKVKNSAGREEVWRAAFQQTGNSVSGTVMPIDGDWGLLTGTFVKDQAVLSRFDGIRANLLKVKLTERGTLEVDANSGALKGTGERVQQSTARPEDPNAHAKVKNPNVPFRFSFPDLDGKTVSLADARFKGKVVLVTIMGSWCPNCHDEAPVLNELYEKYKNQGLEVIALAFEYTGDVTRDREQVRIFNRRHNTRYTTLLAGTTDEGEVARKLPQLENFGAYPTTIYIGRDGKVKRIHTGFDGPATGERFTKLKSEMDAFVKELLEAKS